MMVKAGKRSDLQEVIEATGHLCRNFLPSDFMEQKSLVQEVIEAAGHLCRNFIAS
jgi:hypothetical protein